MKKMISSLQNPLIKTLLTLQEKPRERRKQNLLVIEGMREVGQAIGAGLEVVNLIFCPEIVSPSDETLLLARLPASCDVVEVTRQVYNRLAYRKDSEGLIVMAQGKTLTLQGLTLPDNPLIMILEKVEKPGNLGALLRTADAAHIDAVILCDTQTDLYNPNIIRSSLGTVFTNNVVVTTSREALDWLIQHEITIFAALVDGNTWYHQVDYIMPTAIVMGSEALGLSETWHEQAHWLIKIPMRGKVDSLNVSASAAIIVFEAMRQRGFHP